MLESRGVRDVGVFEFTHGGLPIEVMSTMKAAWTAALQAFGQDAAKTATAATATRATLAAASAAAAVMPTASSILKLTASNGTMQLKAGKIKGCPVTHDGDGAGTK